MGIPCKVAIEPDELGWECGQCSTPLVKRAHHIPGEFWGKHGDAIFVSNVSNIKRSTAKPQNMVTGKYLVQTISCRFCDEYLGWAYVKAYNQEQQHKAGKFCIEVECTRRASPKSRASSVHDAEAATPAKVFL